MKRCLIALLLSLLSICAARAEQPPAFPGSLFVQAGLGIITKYTPIVGTIEYGLFENFLAGNFGIGGSLSLYLASGGGYAVGPEISYHIVPTSSLLFDVAGTLGYYFSGANDTHVAFTATGSLFFQPKFGIFGALRIPFASYQDVGLVLGVKFRL